jgi:hypothetical protein
MRLFELLSQNYQQQLDQLDQQQQQQNQQPPGLADQSADQEDDGQGKFDADKVDSSLKDIAQSANDQNAQPDLPAGAEGQPEELDNQNVKPIDSALMSQIKNLPYSTRYPWNDNDPLHPLKIAAMSLADLSNLKNMVNYKIQARSIQNRVGLDDDIDMQFYIDLLKLVNTVMKFKKTSTSAQLASVRPSPSYQSLQSS